MTKLENEVDIYMDASVSLNVIGLAWTCPEVPALSGYHTMFNNHATNLEAELHAINHAMTFLAYDTDYPLPPSIRILTDSYEALETITSHKTTNPLAHQILYQAQLLQRNKTQVRIDWVPGHEPSSSGNQAAHEVAQESAHLQPPLAPDEEPAP